MSSAKTGKAKPRPKPKAAAKGNGNVAVLSEAGAAFIARFEGFSPALYNDPGTPPNATIGFGHVVHAGPVRGDEAAAYRKGITRQQALELLRRDAANAAAAVRRCVEVPLDQPQFDALVSFTFNCGAGSLERSTQLRKLNAGDYEAVPKELRRWVKAGQATLPGLVARRAAEGKLFSTGVYR